MALAADIVLTIHFTFIVFVAVGGLPALRWPGLAVLHLPALAWGAAVLLFGFICPLTPLENRLRAAAGQAGTPGGFIDRYLAPVIYPEGLTREAQVMLAIGVLLVNALIYTLVAAKRRQRSKKP